MSGQNNFKFWKDNKISQEFIISGEKLVNQFNDWLKDQEQKWLNYYNNEVIIREYLTSPTGLNSTFDDKDFMRLYRLLKKEIPKYRGGQTND